MDVCVCNTKKKRTAALHFGEDERYFSIADEHCQEHSQKRGNESFFGCVSIPEHNEISKAARGMECPVLMVTPILDGGDEGNVGLEGIRMYQRRKDDEHDQNEDRHEMQREALSLSLSTSQYVVDDDCPISWCVVQLGVRF